MEGEDLVSFIMWMTLVST